MKKILISLLLLCSISSCKKTYQCECTTIKDEPGNYSKTFTSVPIEGNKDSAKQACEKQSSTSTTINKVCVIE
jgi:hypothetical protein